MKKILPVHKPYVSHTPESSFLFSILPNIPTSDEWICFRLFSMVVRKENVHDEFSMIGNFFTESPFFHIVNVRDEVVNSILTLPFSDCIEKAINSGYYVSAMINTKYINNYMKDIDSLHHIHIFGYDAEKQMVHIADHFRKGYYTFEECSFTEINQSRDEVKSDIAFVKLLSDVRFDLTLEMMVSLVQEHLNGDNLFDKYNIDNTIYPCDPSNNYFFGLQYYDCMIEILMDGKFPYKRPIVLIYEHTKIIKMFIAIIQRKLLVNVDHLFLFCDELIKTAESLKLYYMKVQIINYFDEMGCFEIKNRDQIEKITELLHSVKEKEKELLEKILLLLEGQTICSIF